MDVQLVTTKDGYFWREFSKYISTLETLGNKHNRQCDRDCWDLQCIRNGKCVCVYL